jgi:hypothetical protein
MYDFKKIFQIDRLIPILLIFFLLITNSYYGEYEINPSATSSNYYLNISNSFPQGMSLENTSQAYIHGERFLISYFVGFVGKLLNVRNFVIFEIFTYFTIFVLISINYKIIDSIVPDKGNKVLYFSLFLLNPYILRFSIANPVMINDLIFITSISLLFFSFLNKKSTLFYLALLLAIISRQTSVLIILALSLSLILPHKNEFIDIKKIFFSVLMLIANYLISQQYLDSSNINAFYESQFFGLIHYFQNNFDFLKFLKFIALPFLSFGPLFIIIIIKFFKNEISFMLNERNIFFSLLLILFVSQPLLSGPLIAGKNIIRLSSFGYFSLIFLFCLNLKYYKYETKGFSIIFFILILFWSLHPTFSKIKIFDLLKVSPIF